MDENHYGNLIRPDAGHARLVPVRRRGHRHAGTAAQARREGCERRDEHRGRPAVRRRDEQPQRPPRAQPRHLGGNADVAHIIVNAERQG